MSGIAIVFDLYLLFSWQERNRKKRKRIGNSSFLRSLNTGRSHFPSHIFVQADRPGYYGGELVTGRVYLKVYKKTFHAAGFM